MLSNVTYKLLREMVTVIRENVIFSTSVLFLQIPDNGEESILRTSGYTNKYFAIKVIVSGLWNYGDYSCGIRVRVDNTITVFNVTKYIYEQILYFDTSMIDSKSTFLKSAVPSKIIIDI